MKHIISIDDLDLDFIDQVFALAEEYKERRQYRFWANLWNELSVRLRHRLMITDFFEPSTRTRLSFEAAMTYLGGNVIGTENAAEFSSIKKGESIADNFRVISGYCDIIVGRFLNEGDARIAADASMVPLINGGDGMGEHPTQALIDLFSIKEKFPDVKDLRVTFIGDNKHSRTVRSLARLLARFPWVSKMNFIGRPEINFTADDSDGFIHELVQISNNYNEYHPYSIGFLCEDWLNPDTIKNHTDIIYMTRSQTERYSNLTSEQVNVKGIQPSNFVLTPEIANLMPDNGLILHPLPRTTELPIEVDNNPRAYYFQQAHNGLFVRIALLETLLCRL